MVGKRLKALATGTAILTEWLGDGGDPVPVDQAEDRAMICKHGGGDLKPCPKNWHGDWWTRVTAEMAMAILNQRRLKSTAGITTSNEHLLGTCEVCLCHLPLKVHVPLDHILKHTSKQVWDELPEHCWIKQEASRKSEQRHA